VTLVEGRLADLGKVRKAEQTWYSSSQQLREAPEVVLMRGITADQQRKCPSILKTDGSTKVVIRIFERSSNSRLHWSTLLADGSGDTRIFRQDPAWVQALASNSPNPQDELDPAQPRFD
jgi:hypothetical protein